MYCRKCGNKLLDSDKFCAKCGNKIILEEKNSKIKDVKNIESQEQLQQVSTQLSQEDNVNLDNNSKKLPMNWWKFWQYFRLPVGLLISIYNLSYYSEATINFITIIVFIANIVLICLIGYAFYGLIERKKFGYNVLITVLFLEPLWNCFFNCLENCDSSTQIAEFIITFLFAFGFICAVWVYPNYVYFTKRKKLFCM
ncbi:MAG: zinc-ribbon domain-containing protein [Clostridia bacterium]